MSDISKQADQWIRANKKKLLAKFCDDTFESSDKPVTIFMAGTPGAGKTEFSLKLLGAFDKRVVRIDADEIRDMMRDIGYNGPNAEHFQNAASKGVNILFDRALHKKYSALLDGTFAYGNWRENIERSLRKDRIVEIYYLYQDPLIAWEYVQLRQKNQGRAVPLNVFVNSYEQSMENVQKAKEVFGKNVTIYFAKNDYTKNVESVAVDVNDIAKLLPKTYNGEELKQILHARKIT